MPSNYFLQILDRHNNTIQKLATALIFLIGIGYAFYLGNPFNPTEQTHHAKGVGYTVELTHSLRYVDEVQYVKIAHNLVNLGEYSLIPGSPTAYRPPGYVLLLAGLLNINIPIEGLRIINFLFLGFISVLLCKIASRGAATSSIYKQNLSNFAPMLIPVAVLLYPLFFYTAGTLYPQLASGFFFCLFIYLISQQSQSLIKLTLAGLVYGFLILIVSVHVLLMPIIVIWALLTKTISLKRSLWVCAVALMVVSPWLARNHAVYHSFPLFGTNSGLNLLLGNSPTTTANSGVRVDMETYRIEGELMDELSRNKLYTKAAIDHIKSQPIHYLSLYFKKLANWFNVSPNLAHPGQKKGWLHITVLGLGYYSMLLLVMLRIYQVKARPLSPAESLTLLFYIAAAAAYAIFFTRIRFRVPFDLLLLLPAAHGLSYLLQDLLRTPSSAYNEAK